jgi:putative Mn2+ efflux pump MntP
MNPISVYLLALSANLDNFAVAIAYGLKRLRININTSLFIALVSAMGTFLSISVGLVFRDYCSAEVANSLGSGTLIAFGMWGVWSTLSREKKRGRRSSRIHRERVHAAIGFASTSSPFDETYPSSEEFLQEFSYELFLENPEKADADNSGHIDIREAIALAFGLSLNNLGIGVGAGISGFNVELTTGLTFTLSLLAMSSGYMLGHRFRAKTSSFWTGVFSSGLVIITGIYESFVF